MPTQSSIYSNCNPQLIKLFEQAGHPAKVMCVALDYAKGQHPALICNGLGDLLKGTFAVENTPAGLKALLGQVRPRAKQRKIRPEHLFFGGRILRPWPRISCAGYGRRSFWWCGSMPGKPSHGVIISKLPTMRWTGWAARAVV